ncbi:DUF421 domain-containing protein [Tranquillimonas alkanivorans]|uniref:YetF C-terminal domain-containing protein n=1 Tax=Tranquillimonas alkanivorans TaxID=441119 RepID=A0A1I5MMP1_9RHOB|nr:YetF domain-containing protein [Tranquillimonas alkanivorans]SFP10206.1 Protein of unknown function [Tranquillimonas alkanivorans]
MNSSVGAMILPFLDTLVVVPATILLVRLLGLRSFSKMSAVDFVVTVAIGSTIASTVLLPDTPFWTGVAALVALFLIQGLSVTLRTFLAPAKNAIDNAPILVMEHGEIREDALRAARLTRGDVYSKLRAQNVKTLSEVRAVVFETTGDISVMTGSGPVEDVLLEGVRRHP